MTKNVYTIGYIDHNFNVYEKHLLPSLCKLKGNFETISISSEKNNPAYNYNKIIENANNDLIILCHEDVSFNSDLLIQIDKTIDHLDNKWSCLGFVGRCYYDEGYVQKWANRGNVHRCETLDCCFIVIRKSHNVKFDEITFDDFHLYVEDYCIEAEQKTKLPIYTILMSSYEGNKEIEHHSATMLKLGSCWGRYNEYKLRLNKKHNRYIKTT